jgi:hypothetical protein
VKWCPLGEGLVSRSFFAQLKAGQFAGPIAQHFEYELGDRAEMLKHFKADFAVLKAWLAG